MKTIAVVPSNDTPLLKLQSLTVMKAGTLILKSTSPDADPAEPHEVQAGLQIPVPEIYVMEGTTAELVAVVRE